jgi:hypothetical protein
MQYRYRETRQGPAIARVCRRCANVGNIVPGVFQPVLAKHSKHFSLQNALSIGVDQMQRNFEPMRRQVEEWRSRQIFKSVI